MVRLLSSSATHLCPSFVSAEPIHSPASKASSFTLSLFEKEGYEVFKRHRRPDDGGGAAPLDLRLLVAATTAGGTARSVSTADVVAANVGAILVSPGGDGEIRAILNEIRPLVESAQMAKSPVQKFADCISKYFVPLVSKKFGLKDIMMPPHRRSFKDVYLVYELMDTDLHQIIKSSQALTNDHCQYFLFQVLHLLTEKHN